MKLKARFDLFAHYNMAFLYELTGMKKYIRDTEKKILSDQHKFNEYLNKRLLEIPDSDHGSVFVELEEDYFHHQRILPNLLYNSVFISLDSFVEVNLMAVCNMSREFFVAKINHSDITGNGITRFINYLELVIDIKLKDSHLLGTIKQYHSIRNIFIHSGGWVNVDEQSQLS